MTSSDPGTVTFWVFVFLIMSVLAGFGGFSMYRHFYAIDRMKQLWKERYLTTFCILVQIITFSAYFAESWEVHETLWNVWIPCFTIALALLSFNIVGIYLDTSNVVHKSNVKEKLSSKSFKSIKKLKNQISSRIGRNKESSSDGYPVGPNSPDSTNTTVPAFTPNESNTAHSTLNTPDSGRTINIGTGQPDESNNNNNNNNNNGLAGEDNNNSSAVFSVSEENIQIDSMDGSNNNHNNNNAFDYKKETIDYYSTRENTEKSERSNNNSGNNNKNTMSGSGSGSGSDNEKNGVEIVKINDNDKNGVDNNVNGKKKKKKKVQIQSVELKPMFWKGVWILWIGCSLSNWIGSILGWFFGFHVIQAFSYALWKFISCIMLCLCIYILNNVRSRCMVVYTRRNSAYTDKMSRKLESGIIRLRNLIILEIILAFWMFVGTVYEMYIAIELAENHSSANIYASSELAGVAVYFPLWTFVHIILLTYTWIPKDRLK